MDQNNNNQMNDQYYRGGNPQSEAYYSPELTRNQDQRVALYLAKVMAWMCVGLMITLATAITCLYVPAIQMMLFGTGAYMLIFFVQLALVFGFSASLSKMNAAVSTVLYLLYSVFTGITFSVLAFVFTVESIVFVFGVTGLVFLMMAVYGFVTKKDLTRLGTLAIFGLIGIILISLLNMLLLRSTQLELLICCVGVVIFMALISYDTQKIKGFYLNSTAAGYDESSAQLRTIAIFGAFTLYLDFINLFLRLLQLFGRRRN